MAMRQRALDLQLLRPVPIDRPALEQRLQLSITSRRQLAQIGQRALLRPAMLVAIALPQQHRGRRIAIGHASR